jgi:predicted PurR-regulated permease PerM
MQEYQQESVFRRAQPIFVALLMALIVVATVMLLLRLTHLLIILFVSLIFAAALSGPVERLHSRFGVPKGVAVVGIYLVVFGILGLLLWFIVPPFFRQLADVEQEFPSYVHRLEALEDQFNELAKKYPELGNFNTQINNLAGTISSGAGAQLARAPGRAFGMMIDLLSIFFISMLIVTNRMRLENLIVMAIGPTYEPTTRRVARRVWDRIGSYIGAKIIQMVIIGGLFYILLTLVGMKFALLLAITVALGELIPLIGPWIARVPLWGFAALDGWQTFLIIVIASIVIENLKGIVLSPIIDSRSLKMHPLLAFISVLVGGGLLGAGGAFIAVPFAAAVQVCYEEIYYPWRSRQFEAARAATGEHAGPAVDATVEPDTGPAPAPVTGD